MLIALATLAHAGCWELDNGVRVIVETRMPGSGQVTAGWFSRLGSADGLPGATALSIAAMQGTMTVGGGDPEAMWDDVQAGRPTAQGSIDAVAETWRRHIDATPQASVAPDIAGVLTSIRPTDVPGWLWLTTDSLRNPVLRDLRAARSAVEATNPVPLDALFLPDALARPADGGPGGLDRLGFHDIAQHQARLLHPRNLTLVLVGDVTDELWRAETTRHLDTLGADGPGWTPPPVTPLSHHVEGTAEGDAPKVTVRLPAPQDDTDAWGLLGWAHTVAESVPEGSAVRVDGRSPYVEIAWLPDGRTVDEVLSIEVSDAALLRARLAARAAVLDLPARAMRLARTSRCALPDPRHTDDLTVERVGALVQAARSAGRATFVTTAAHDDPEVAALTEALGELTGELVRIRLERLGTLDAAGTRALVEQLSVERGAAAPAFAPALDLLMARAHDRLARLEGP